MKKISVLVAALFAGAMMFVGAGCNADDADAILGPTNTWCETSYKYGGSEDANPIYIDVIYSDSDLNGTEGSANLKNGTTLPAGITVVVFAKAEIKSLGMSANTYIMKTFPKNGSDNNSEDNSSFSITGSRAKWTAMYLAKADLRKTTTQLKHPSAPAPLTNGGGYTKLTDIPKNFSWKSIIADYLLR